MQVLDVQPTNPTPYTPAGGTYNNNPTPGAGGLPALSGLTRNVNPLANELQGQGRGEDSVLVHMTPNEVNSLRGLAHKFGGDLTTNPNTGLPEAGFLSKILPTLLGVGLSFIPGVGPLAAAGIVGAGTTAVTGDLQKGLMAGLGAYGGASLAGALTAAPATAAGAGAGAAGSTTLQTAAPTIAQTAATQAPTTLLPAATQTAAGTIGSVGSAITPQLAALPAEIGAAASGLGATAPAASSGILGQFGSKFGAAAREGLKAGTLPYKLAPAAAGLGLASTASEVLQPEMPKYEKEEDKWKYEGPYRPMARNLRPRVAGEGEISFFEESNPYPGYMTAAGNLPAGFAEGGETSKNPIAPELSDFVKMFQTSPGPITASRTYEGGSPSERIRAAAQANAATPAPAAPAGSPEMDFGFTKSPAASASMAAPYINSALSQFYSPGAGGFNFASLTPEMIANYAAQYNAKGRPMDINESVTTYAKGGVHMDDGAFVVDARTVSELGNGSSSAGQELLARLGGRPVKGPGDGVSDSIPAKIGGTQEARVARDEVIFPAKAVKRLGGAKKLYALMDKAHKARKKAGRGSDTKLRKGLGAL